MNKQFFLYETLLFCILKYLFFKKKGEIGNKKELIAFKNIYTSLCVFTTYYKN